MNTNLGLHHRTQPKLLLFSANIVKKSELHYIYINFFLLFKFYIFKLNIYTSRCISIHPQPLKTRGFSSKSAPGCKYADFERIWSMRWTTGSYAGISP